MACKPRSTSVLIVVPSSAALVFSARSTLTGTVACNCLSAGEPAAALDCLDTPACPPVRRLTRGDTGKDRQSDAEAESRSEGDELPRQRSLLLRREHP